jgi:hypothetical protein
LATDKTEAWFDLTMVLDKQEKIIGVGLEPAAPSEATLPKGLSDTALTIDINSQGETTWNRFAFCPKTSATQR